MLLEMVYRVLLTGCLKMGYIGFRTITNIIMCTVRMERIFTSGEILRYVRF